MKLYPREPASPTLLCCRHLGITRVCSRKYFQHSALVWSRHLPSFTWHTIIEPDDPEL